jgi:hypothetical protein
MRLRSLKKIVLIPFILLLTLNVKAQNHISGFLSDLSIKDFKLNSTLSELKKNEKLNENLIFHSKNGDISRYMVFEKNHEIFGTSNDFYGANFFFIHDTLVRIEFMNFNDPNGGEQRFEKVRNELKYKYGNPTRVASKKNKLYYTYQWRSKDNYLIAMPLRPYFLIIYGKDLPNMD